MGHPGVPELLVELRRAFSQERFPDTLQLLDQLPPHLPAVLLRRLAILRRVARSPMHFTATGPQSNAHVLAFDPHGYILAVHRGVYKRLFGGKMSFTAAAHGSSDPVVAAAGFQLAFALELAPERLVRVGPDHGHAAVFDSVELWGLSPVECERLRRAARSKVEGVWLDYSERKSALAAFSLTEAGAAQLCDLEGELLRTTGVPAMHRVADRGQHTLYAARLTALEATELRRAATARWERYRDAAERAEGTLTADDVAALDADRGEFLPWPEFVGRFQAHPLRFALDVCHPYLSNPATLAEIRKCV